MTDEPLASNNDIDPPLKPMEKPVRWIESGPNAILSDPGLATLIVRIGMASNALDAQIKAARNAHNLPPAAKMCELVCSLVMSAALVHETITKVITNHNFDRLCLLAKQAGASDDVIRRMSDLRGGKDSTSTVLKRARNKLGFHWDRRVVERSVREFGKNERLVWIESDAEQHVVRRLAVDVLAHALFPEVSKQADEAARQHLSVSHRPWAREDLLEPPQHAPGTPSMRITLAVRLRLGTLDECMTA